MFVQEKIFVGVGTNLGNRMENLQRCYELIESKEHIFIDHLSPIYQSPPWGFEASQDFYNTVISIRTTLDPVQLLAELKKIETEMGRTRKSECGYESRIIDLDILDYAGLIITGEALEVPHPKMHLRSFVLLPLQDISPNWMHPDSKKHIKELIQTLNPTEIKALRLAVND
ncbi:MAG: 2-amino-4-hydroxy-6-hydroxymethyldihydropteridine diphosphokinase [Crocinitomicaceae bacterium]|nr:2-amino-4-hydroxy-6-hydroxymethyldihydropteridine diphosphokinase [Crocinitomicaceae bacterium]MBK8926228.1 2-amino-4-hydroxy-6-hydroxymethyldihydropteridine diphosphokinase [Crocinitomicaceae bacterium]